jgi:dynein heavy chain
MTGNEEIVEPLKFISPRTNLNLVQQLCTLIDSMLPPADQNPPKEFDQLEKLYISCITWSLGGCLVAEDREKFSEFIRTTSGLILPSSTLYDNYFDLDSMNFILWERKVPEYTTPAN